MKKLIGSTFALLASVQTFAGDSTWTVCTSKSFVVSAYEHRASADTRQTDITLIYGGHVAKGVLTETSKKIVLDSGTMKLDGEITINTKKNRMTMDGPLTIGSQRFDIEEVLKCSDKTQTTLPGSSGH